MSGVVHVRGTIEASIAFYGRHEAAVDVGRFVLHDCDDMPLSQDEAEVLLFTLFALRELGNLGTRCAADELARLLQGRAAGLPMVAAEDTLGGVTLVPFRGVKGGKKIFLAWLEVTDHGVIFETPGVGLATVDFGAAHHATLAVDALLRWLARLHAGDPAYLAALGSAARMSARMQLERRVEIGDQSELAVAITLKAFA